MANRSTTKKGPSKKKNDKKKNYTNIAIVAVVGIACVGMLLINHFMNKSKETSGSEMITPGVTVAPVEEVTPTVPPAATQTPQVTVTPEPTTSVSPEPSKEEGITEEQALKAVKDAIANETYQVELSDKQLSVDGKMYYEFHVKDGNTAMEPSILVLKKDGTLYYYDKTGMISAFTKFPLDNVEHVGEAENAIEENDAVSRVQKLSRATLGLEKELSEYTIEIDEWTTIVNSESCYCLNVFDQAGGTKQLVAVFYVSVDGTNVYRLDEDSQEFINITE